MMCEQGGLDGSHTARQAGNSRVLCVAACRAFIAAGCQDRRVRVWSAASMQPLAELEWRAAEIRAVALSEDGSVLGAACQDKSVGLWFSGGGGEDGGGGAGWVAGTGLAGHQGVVTSLCFDPSSCRSARWPGPERGIEAGDAEGVRLATGSYDRTVRFWDVAGGRELMRLCGHSHWVMCVACSADGHRLASASYDRTVRVWNAHTGETLAVLTGHGDRITSVAFSSSPATLRASPPSGHRGLGGGALEPRGYWLASGSFDRTARLWTLEEPHPPDGQQQPQVFAGHSGEVKGVAFVEDRLVTVSSDRKLRVWPAC